MAVPGMVAGLLHSFARFAGKSGTSTGFGGTWVETYDGSGGTFSTLFAEGTGTMDWSPEGSLYGFDAWNHKLAISAPPGCVLHAVEISGGNITGNPESTATREVNGTDIGGMSDADKLALIGTDPAGLTSADAHSDFHATGAFGRLDVRKDSYWGVLEEQAWSFTGTYHIATSVSSVSPNQGPVTGGTPVTVSGGPFWNEAKQVGGDAFTPPNGYAPLSPPSHSVKFGGSFGSFITVVGGSTLTVGGTPGHVSVGPVDVQVILPGGLGTATLVGGFTYLPVITSVTPPSGSEKGGSIVTVLGGGFEPAATTVTFGGVPATDIEVVTDGALICTTPSHAGAGLVDVGIVVTKDGVDYPATLVDGYRYNAINRAPIIEAGQPITLTSPLPKIVTLAASWISEPISMAGITFEWTQVAGPETIVIDTPTNMSTTVTFEINTPGTYQFRITSSSNSETGVAGASDVVTVNFPFPRAPIVSDVKTSVKL